MAIRHTMPAQRPRSKTVSTERRQRLDDLYSDLDAMRRTTTDPAVLANIAVAVAGIEFCLEFIEFRRDLETHG